MRWPGQARQGEEEVHDSQLNYGDSRPDRIVHTHHWTSEGGLWMVAAKAALIAARRATGEATRTEGRMVGCGLWVVVVVQWQQQQRERARASQRTVPQQPESAPMQSLH